MESKNDNGRSNSWKPYRWLLLFIECSLLLLPSSSFLILPHFPSRPQVQVSWQQRSTLNSCLQEAQPVNVDPPHALRNNSTLRTTCKHCFKVLPSRNALFRHLRTDPTCSLKENLASTEMVKETVAISFGYLPGLTQETAMNTSDVIGVLLQETIVDSIRNATCAVRIDSNVKLISATQATVARLRPQSLTQEPDCFASGDVLVLNVMLPKFVNLEMWRTAMENTRDTLQLEGLEITSFQLCGAKSKLQGESGCTQRIYHYLLPLAWLPDAAEIQEWWNSEEANATMQQHHGRRKLARAPPASLRRLKEALRSAECIKRPPEEIRSDTNRTLRIASGRFGALATRERRAWHNFADPSLRGDASPNNEPVWRVLDRVRIIDFLEEESSGVVAVIEFRGDSFLKQQIRRIVGAAVATAHGWLPRNFFELATADHTFVETPLAPSGRLYCAGARYHFEEMLTDGRSLFETHKRRTIVELDSPDLTHDRVQRTMLRKRSVPSASREEAGWLEGLRTVVSSRILAQLSSSTRLSAEAAVPDTSADKCPDLHLPVLEELRRILASGQWPDTSMARSAVIRQNEKRDKTSYGSFTIVNPQVGKNWDVLPLGNERFEKLVKLVFELEMELANGRVDRVTLDGLERGVPTERTSSSHCAVNCNAQFTPHVDSGRGAGQSTSMIIGLGKYAGGELLVEGDEYDIKHSCLEFDGWKLRHWTNPFVGERFSLVWFTPESKS